MAGIIDKLRSIFEKEEEKEVKEMADPAEEANEYMKKKMLFTPRMFKVTNTVAPDVGKKFADFYESVWADGALPRKIKELMFMSIGVAYCSPRCIIHVIPAMRAGATFEEVTGIPYAFEYAAKCLEIFQKESAGEEWEYLPKPKFNRGVY
jgi:alkylhydroperoxidase/carboxymuconolactone decarboxylase family protein YurZ